MLALGVVDSVCGIRTVPFNCCRRFMRAMLALCLLFCLACGVARADVSLSQIIQQHPGSELFQGANRYGEVDPSSSSVPVFRDDERLGFLFLNSDLVNSVGYSGKPIHVLVGLDNEGVIRTVRLIEHSEPIVLVGIPESKITDLMDGYVGFDVVSFLKSPTDDPRFDAISGATVTIRVIDDSIIRSAIKVARAKGLGGLRTRAQGPVASVNAQLQEQKDWTDVVAERSVTRLKLTVDEINRQFAAMEGGEGLTAIPTETPDELFIDLYVAQASVPSIGLSMLGTAEYKNLTRNLKEGKHAILVAAKGQYSFKGSGYVRGGIFDRFELVQGDDVIRFRDLHHKRLRRVAAEGAPEDFREVDLFMIPEDSKLDPAKPWRFQLLVGRELTTRDKLFRTFDLDYRIPDRYLKFETVAAVDARADDLEGFDRPQLWKQLWQEKWLESMVLLVALALLTGIFFFQDWLVRRPVLSRRIRTGFLLFTLFGIGFYSSAQLSVVNILTVFNALVTGFSWEYFLMEPLVFILWGSVAMALLFWGRGAFCGWLCAFGALQEFISRLAKRAGIPQWMLPWGLHERLWPIKYIIFLVLFGVSLHSLALAERLAEVEPFKTVIILKFIRDWPYVILSLLFLAPCLFVERFYCRYLCPLGAALAIPARIRMFDWLKRYRRQCGNPCQVCANECMVQAIHPEGQINPNECHYCLHCQERYYDDQVCPVAVKKRGRLERRQAMSSGKTADLAKQVLIEVREEKLEIKQDIES